MKRLLLALLFLPATAFSQQWDTNTRSWLAPTTCSTGEPITACAVTGYRVERSATATGTFAAIGTTDANTLSFTHTSAAAGQNCYRQIALSSNGESGPSNVVCRTNTRPVGPPSPPVQRTVDTVVYNLRQYGREVLLGEAVGSAPLNTLCGKLPLVEDFRVVARSNVKFKANVALGVLLVARCG